MKQWKMTAIYQMGCDQKPSIIREGMEWEDSIGQQKRKVDCFRKP